VNTAALATHTAAQPSPTVAGLTRQARLEGLVREHLAFVWRTACHMGLGSADADDVTQRVMLIAAARLDDLVEGKERAFLLGTTIRVAQKAHRTRRRKREEPGDGLFERAAAEPAPDELVDQRRARVEFDRITRELPEELRMPFVLFEVEGWSQPEIGAALGVPVGTVASRIRRAREVFLRLASRQRLLVKGISP
jgi:RNA polymerase sigma-70 factor, ECF subfamily